MTRLVFGERSWRVRRRVEDLLELVRILYPCLPSVKVSCKRELMTAPRYEKKN